MVERERGVSRSLMVQPHERVRAYPVLYPIHLVLYIKIEVSWWETYFLFCKP